MGMQQAARSAFPTSSATSTKPVLLAVDDEPHVLEGMRDRLRRSFDVRTAASGAEGLKLLQADPDAYAIVISDMRMPGMAGDVFLSQARMFAPNAVRLLLTGHADTEAAIRAVNNAQLFRFLTKPVEGEELLRACAAALSHHRLLTAERVILEQTLRGAVDALAGILAIASPAAFGRGGRVKLLVSRLADAVQLKDRWEAEVAAMLAHIGAVTLPPATAEKWYSGDSLTIEEIAMIQRIPRVTRQLLGNIPRLEGVLEIIDAYQTTPEAGNPLSIGAIPEPARMLRIAIDYDSLETAGSDPSDAIAIMRHKRIYDPFLLTKLGELLGVGAAAANRPVIEVALAELRVGMTLADDVRNTGGGLLVARGQVVNEHLIERLENLSPFSIRQPLHVLEAVDR